MALTKYTHDPNARLDYGEDWTPWLEANEIIEQVVVTASGTGLVDVEAFSVVAEGKQVVAWVSGGVVGATSTLTFHIETSVGRQDDRSMSLVVKER